MLCWQQHKYYTKETTNISTNIEELAKRVAYLEREMQRTGYVIDGLQQRTDTRLKEIDAHLDRQDKDLQDFKESVEKRFGSFEASVDTRFEHVYGQLADISSNVADIRNIVATLVEKLA